MKNQHQQDAATSGNSGQSLAPVGAHSAPSAAEPTGRQWGYLASPAPWYLTRSDSGMTWLCAAGGKHIATIMDRDVNVDEDARIQEANGVLMKAAPALRDACAAVVADPDSCDGLALCKAALAAAGGAAAAAPVAEDAAADRDWLQRSNDELRRDLAGQVRQCEALRAEVREVLSKATYADGLATVHTQDCEALEAAMVNSPVRQSVNVQLLEALRQLADASATVGNLDHAGAQVPADAWADMYQANNAARAAVAEAERQLKENDEAMWAQWRRMANPLDIPEVREFCLSNIAHPEKVMLTNGKSLHAALVESAR